MFKYPTKRRLWALGTEPVSSVRFLDDLDSHDKTILAITYWLLRLMVVGSLLFFAALFVWMWLTGEVAPI